MVSTSLLLGIGAAFVPATSAKYVTKGPSSSDEYSAYRGTQRQSCYFYHDTDYSGGFDIGNKPNKNYKDCDDICMGFKGCVTWSWNKDNGGTCWLKSKASDFVEKPGVVSLSCELDKSKPEPSKDQFSAYRGKNGEYCYYYHDWDYKGNDVGSKPGKYYQDCNDICMGFKGCYTWSWSNHNGGTCWLKSKTSDLVASPATVSLSCEFDKSAPEYDVNDRSPFRGENFETCYHYKDFDYKGNDVGNKPAKDYHECNQICMDFRTCYTWSWTNHNGGTCWLKSQKGDLVRKDGAFSLTCAFYKRNSKRAMKTHGKTHHHASTTIKFHHGNLTLKISTKQGAADIDRAGTDSHGKACYYLKDLDYPGFDIDNKPAKDYHDCNNLCSGVKGCVTWSWNNHNGGTCWLKSHIGSGADVPGTVSLGCEMYVPSEGSGVCKNHQNIDFVGNDIGNKPGKFPEECCAICDRTNGCSAYAWTNGNGGTCYLKSSVVPSYILYNEGVVSGSTKSLNGYTLCPFEFDTDYAGNDIGNKPAQSAESCCSLCKSNKACKAYSWNSHNGGTCWMKSGTGKRSKAAGVVSATLV
jgi:hypothetical protein